MSKSPQKMQICSQLLKKSIRDNFGFCVLSTDEMSEEQKTLVFRYVCDKNSYNYTIEQRSRGENRVICYLTVWPK